MRIEIHDFESGGAIIVRFLSIMELVDGAINCGDPEVTDEGDGAIKCFDTVEEAYLSSGRIDWEVLSDCDGENPRAVATCDMADWKAIR